MPLRSVLAVDVDDQAFQDFLRTFQKYQDAVTKLPGTWSNVNKQTTATKSAFADMTAALMAQAEMIARITKGGEQQERQTARTASSWQSMQRTTRDVARNILSATDALLKWTGILGGVSGLLGVGGLWGIDRMAASAAGMRREATGFAAPSGQISAFNLSYRRFIDTGSMLSGVSSALIDPGKRWQLMAASGLSSAQLSRMNTTDVASAILPALRRRLKGAPESMGRSIADAFGAGSMSDTDLRRLRGSSDSEFGEAGQNYRTRSQQLAIGDPALKAWTDLNDKLSTAGQTIENVFIKQMAALAEPIGHLSDEVTKAVKSFLEHPELGNWINDFSKGIEQAANYMGSKEFQDDFRGFTEGIAHASATLREFVKSISDVIDFLNVKKTILGLGAATNDMVTSAAGAARRWLSGGSSSNFRSPDGSIADPGSLFKAISHAEGTTNPDGSINYDAIYYKDRPPPKPLSSMTLGEVNAYAQTLPAGTAPMGAFQIQGRTTMLNAAQALRMSPSDMFNRENQERMASWLAANRGLGQWTGFNAHPANLAAAQRALSGGGGRGMSSFRPGGGGGLRSDVSAVLNLAKANMPEGYQVVLSSGARMGGLSNSQHHGGGAADVTIYGPDGKAIPNTDQGPGSAYGLFARYWYAANAKLFPGEERKAAWGYRFDTTPGSGVADSMHFDRGGDRGYRGEPLRNQYMRDPVKITVENTTGGSAAVSGNQVGR